MKKKFLLIVTAVLFALSCVIGLVACNKGGGNEVTENEWSSAVESVAESETYTFTVKKGDVTYTYNADVKNERYHITATKGEQSMQAIYAKEGGMYFVYTEAGAAAGAALFAATTEPEWIKTAITEEQFNFGTAECRLMISIMVAAKGSFGSFAYNAEEKKYTAENMTLGNVGTADKITAVFEDGVLVSFDFQGFAATGSDEKADYTYGGTPTENVVAPEISAEEAWAAAFAALAIRMNFTMDQKYNSNIIDGIVEYDGYSVKLRTDTYSKEYFMKEEETYYTIYDNDGQWVKEEISAQEYELNVVGEMMPYYLGLVEMIAENFSAFTLSEGVYTAAEISGDYGTLTDVKVTFENGSLKEFEFTAEDWTRFRKIGTTTVEFPQVTE